MLKANDPRIYQILLDGMDHDDPAIRLECLRSLRAITGKDLGSIRPPGGASSSRLLRRDVGRGRPPQAPAAAARSDNVGTKLPWPALMRSVRDRLAPRRRCRSLTSFDSDSTRHGSIGANLAIMKSTSANRDVRPGCRSWRDRGVRRPPRSVAGAEVAGREGTWTRTRSSSSTSTRSARWSRPARPARWARPRPQRIEPSVDPGEIHSRQALTTEMVEALGAGLRPPFGGLHDIRPLVRRAQKGGVLEAGRARRDGRDAARDRQPRPWLARVGDQFPRLGGLRQGVGEFSGLAVAIEGCLDNRGKVLDTASRRLSALRREIGRVAGTNPGDAPADAPLARDPKDPPLSQFHDGRAPLCLARRQGPPRRDPGLGPPHQRQQRDRLRRAHRHRRAVGPAFVPPRAEAKEVRRILRWLSRPGRHGGGVAAGHARDHGRARPDPRPGAAQHRLSDVGPALQPGGQAGAPRRPASLARSAVPERSGHRRRRRSGPPPPVPTARTRRSDAEPASHRAEPDRSRPSDRRRARCTLAPEPQDRDADRRESRGSDFRSWS